MFELSPTALDQLEFALGPRAKGGRGDAAGAAKATRSLARFGSGLFVAAAGAMPFSVFGKGTHSDRSRRAMEALARTVNRSPEVMVKVTGRQNGGEHVLANFTYISREGWGENEEIEILTDRGEILRTHDEKAAVAARWRAWEMADAARRQGATSISMVLSMPSGTDHVGLFAAVRAFADEEMGNRSWVMALHTDTESPHVHLTVARRDHDGNRFHPGREDLFKYRLVFAEKLRERGIDANATPRKARGITKKPVGTAIVQIERRGERSRYLQRLRTEALNTLKTGAIHTMFDSLIASQQRDVAEGYKAAAVELAAASDKTVRALAGSIVTHLRGMAAIETRAAENVRILKEALTRAQDKGQPPSTPQKPKEKDRER